MGSGFRVSVHVSVQVHVNVEDTDICKCSGAWIQIYVSVQVHGLEFRVED